MTDKDKDAKNFILELKALLTKHNASISFGCSSCSDTYGLYEERIEADFDCNSGSKREVTIKLADGWHVSAQDLEEL